MSNRPKNPVSASEKPPSVWFKKLTQSQLDRLELWRVFSLHQGEILPPQLAADYLRMTAEGLRKAAARGWLQYIRIGRNRFYGKKSLETYKFTKSKKFPENQRIVWHVNAEFKLPKDHTSDERPNS